MEHIATEKDTKLALLVAEPYTELRMQKCAGYGSV